VIEWKTKATALDNSGKNLQSKGKKERQDWLFHARRDRDDLAQEYYIMDAIGQSDCMSLMMSINTLVDRQIAEQGDDLPVGVSQEPSGVNDYQQKGNLEEKGALGETKASRTWSADRSDGQRNDPDEDSAPRPPLSALGRSKKAQPSQSPELNSRSNQERPGTWLNLVHC
jgi:hypothetical protein